MIDNGFGSGEPYVPGGCVILGISVLLTCCRTMRSGLRNFDEYFGFPNKVFLRHAFFENPGIWRPKSIQLDGDSVRRWRPKKELFRGRQREALELLNADTCSTPSGIL